MPPERAREAIEAGWAEPHPPDGPTEELDVIFQLVVDSYNYVTGRAVSATEIAARAG